MWVWFLGHDGHVMGMDGWADGVIVCDHDVGGRSVVGGCAGRGGGGAGGGWQLHRLERCRRRTALPFLAASTARAAAARLE